MSNQSTLNYRALINNSIQRYSGSLSQMHKSAADEEAISGIKDPNCEGTVSIPTGDGSKPALRNMPPNGANTANDADKQHHIMDVTKPNGVGEGEYTTPRNGDARDAAATSPTTPLDKIAHLAGALRKAAEAVETPATPAPAAPETPAAPATDGAEKVANTEPQMPESLNNPDILMKLASLGAYMMGTEQGRQAVHQTVARELGIKEAAAIVRDASELLKQASAQQPVAPQLTKEAFTKIAAAKMAHKAWLDSFETDLEKQAYMAGAADGDAMADAVEAGVDPATIEANAGQVADEEAMALFRQLIEAGIMTPEEAEAIMAAADADQNAQVTPDELLAYLQAAVQSGEMPVEQADAIAQAYIAQNGGAAPAEAGAEEAAAEAPADEEAVKSAAAKSAQNVADLINTLYATK